MVLVVPLLMAITLACQNEVPGADEVPDAASGATPATESAASDTPPADAGKDTAGGGEQAAGGEQQAAAGQGSGDPVNGWKQYEANCSRCHGQDALGSSLAPDLRESVKGALDQGGFAQVVMNGRVDKGMPAFAKQLEDRQVSDIYAYVMARSSGKLGPGRPGG